MLIHGRLVLTAHGLMLDEVRSLLQKALRRKDDSLILSATRELIGYGKDQLPWKALVTFLFEDHCLSDLDILNKMVRCHNDNDKYQAVELLYQCYTCRVAACVPVVTLEPEYEPVHWDTDSPVPEEYQGLLAVSPGEINCARLLLNLVKAWKEQNMMNLMTYFKMASMVEDVMQSKVTAKGMKILIKKVKKPRPTHIFLSILHTATVDLHMQQYIRQCFALSCVPDVCLRLVLCSVLTHLMFREKVQSVNDLKLGAIDWTKVPKLCRMPSWAVDKHTFRGKHGKGTKHLVKTQPKDMTEEEYKEFHGERPKHGLEHFFEEGCKCDKLSMDMNPFWERTKQIYYSKPHKLQKTTHMTKVYYAEMLQKYPHIKVKARKKTSELVSDSEEEMKTGSNKRTRTSVENAKRTRTSKTDDVYSVEPMTSEKTELKKCTNVKKTSKDSAETVEYKSLNLPGPLLQLPTGSGKLYTCLNLSSKKVVKGPYPKPKLSMTIFFHKGLRDILLDTHTMPIEVDGKSILFNLYQGVDGDLTITKKDFYDAISKKNIKEGEFVLRESLGIVQVHRIPAARIHNVPMSFWVHYVYRAALNIGDSGLYNAITNKDLSFLYGIDMEEQRRTVRSGDLLDVMFVKRPASANCAAILKSIASHKKEIKELLDREVDYEKLATLAEECGYDSFDRDLFEKRLKTAKSAIDRMG